MTIPGRAPLGAALAILLLFSTSAGWSDPPQTPTASPEKVTPPPALNKVETPKTPVSPPAEASRAEQSSPQPPFAQIFANLAKKLAPVVVNISTTKAIPRNLKDAIGGAPPGAPLNQFFREFFGKEGTPGPSNPSAPHIASLGSGFIIDPSGLIVTNNHVIDNADKIWVTLSDNATLPAKIVGRDPISDLALLKVDPKKPLPAASWGDSKKVRVGDWILAIGNPFGLGGTVTSGIISATARNIRPEPYIDFLQTDAAINRGDSGGPMFNLKGKVIGIDTAILTPSGGSVGIGFAIPSADARPIIEQLETTGKVVRGWIGARIQPVTAAIAEAIGLKQSRGAMIAAIDPDSPAAGKLKPGDVILDYDGKAVEESRGLPRLVAATPPGKTVKIAIWRDNREKVIALKVAELNPNRPVPSAPEPKAPPPPPGVDVLGLKLALLTPQLQKRFSLPHGAKGAVVIAVRENSRGAELGLRPGDLVIAVGTRPVTSPNEVKKGAVEAQKHGKKNVLIRVERGGSTRFFALPVASS